VLRRVEGAGVELLASVCQAELLATARQAELLATARQAELLATARQAELLATARQAELLATARQAELLPLALRRVDGAAVELLQVGELVALDRGRAAGHQAELLRLVPRLVDGAAVELPAAGCSAELPAGVHLVKLGTRRSCCRCRCVGSRVRPLSCCRRVSWSRSIAAELLASVCQAELQPLALRRVEGAGVELLAAGCSAELPAGVHLVELGTRQSCCLRRCVGSTVRPSSCCRWVSWSRSIAAEPLVAGHQAELLATARQAELPPLVLCLADGAAVELVQVGELVAHHQAELPPRVLRRVEGAGVELLASVCQAELLACLHLVKLPTRQSCCCACWVSSLPRAVAADRVHSFGGGVVELVAHRQGRRCGRRAAAGG